MPRRQAQIAADKVVATKAFADDLTVTSALNVGANSDFVIKSTLGSSDDNFTILIGNSSTGEGGSAGNSSIYIGPNAGLDSSGSTFNIGIGKDSLSGAQMVANGNVCVGVSTGIEITEGDNNTVIGFIAGSLLTTGDNNTVIGKSVGASLTTGDSNTMIGSNSDCSATLNNQIAIGYQATCDLANQCTIGNSSMAVIRPGTDNVCDLGESDMRFKDLHLSESAFIGKTGQFQISANDGTNDVNFSIKIGNSTTGGNLGNSSGQHNILIGQDSGAAITSGTGNIGIGKDSLENVVSTANNVAIGLLAGRDTTGSSNTFIGGVSGQNFGSGDNNTLIGAGTIASANLDNQMSLGSGATCDLANQCTIGNSSMAIIRSGADNVCDLGESDRQFKDLYLSGGLIIDTIQVVGSQSATIADATDAASVITQLNDLLAKLRVHGLIDT